MASARWASRPSRPWQVTSGSNPGLFIPEAAGLLGDRITSNELVKVEKGRGRPAPELLALDLVFRTELPEICTATLVRPPLVAMPPANVAVVAASSLRQAGEPELGELSGQAEAAPVARLRERERRERIEQVRTILSLKPIGLSWQSSRPELHAWPGYWPGDSRATTLTGTEATRSICDHLADDTGEASIYRTPMILMS